VTIKIKCNQEKYSQEEDKKKQLSLRICLFLKFFVFIFVRINFTQMLYKVKYKLYQVRSTNIKFSGADL